MDFGSARQEARTDAQTDHSAKYSYMYSKTAVAFIANLPPTMIGDNDR